MATTSATPKSTPFEEEAKDVLQRLRAALNDLLVSVGADPTRPQDVARQLGINKNLTWKISKIIRETDPGSVFPQIPGKEGFRLLLRATRKKGAQDELIDLAETAIARFDDLIETHSGDRDTLELMARQLSGEIDLARIESERKLAFRGNSAIWGVQARMQLCINVIFPSDDPDWADLAWVSGLVDFRRLRNDVSWTIASARKADDSGAALPIGVVQPLDPKFADGKTAPLLGTWCSEPFPEVRVDSGNDGLVRYQLVEGPIGNTAATTCVIGIMGRRFVRRTRSENDTIGEHNIRLYTPVEHMVHDLFVHRDLTHALHPRAFLYSQLPNIPTYPSGGRTQGLLPLPEGVQNMGFNPPDVVLAELPRYRQLTEALVRNTGWHLKDFHGFRLRMRYPPIPTLGVLRYDLP